MFSFDFYDGPNFAKMVEHIYREYEEKPDSFVKLLEDAKKPLFSGYRKYTKLSSIVHFSGLKTKHGWTDRSFYDFLSLLRDTLPNGNEMPSTMYEPKKTFTTLGIGFEKLHPCLNDCVVSG